MERVSHAPATGIIGTVLGSIGTAGALAAGGMGLLNGNAPRNGNCMERENANLRADVARLTSEKFTTEALLAERDRQIGWVEKLAEVDARLFAVDDKLEKAVEKNKEDIAALREITAKDLEIARLTGEKAALEMEARLGSRIDAVACAGTQTAGAVAALQAVVSKITNVVIPQSVICDTGKACCPANQ